MDGVQLPQCYRATTRRKFTFTYSWYLFDRALKDEKLS